MGLDDAGDSTIIRPQVDHWHAALDEPTLADAILDRLVHNVYKITLKGASMRKRLAILDGCRPHRTNN